LFCPFALKTFGVHKTYGVHVHKGEQKFLECENKIEVNLSPTKSVMTKYKILLVKMA
jgi:hypothetical protein